MNTENKITNEEIIEEKRKRQMAILKASNELLRQAKESALRHTEDPIKRAELEKQFGTALDDNKQMAKSYLHATMDEINNSEYRSVEKEYVDKYKKRLEKKGITDEELHFKGSATVTTSKDKKKGTIERRPRRGKKKDESEIVRVENEEEIMKMTLVKDDDQLRKHIEKNKQYENEKIRVEQNPLEKMKDNIKEIATDSKISINGTPEVGGVTVENATVNTEMTPITVENTTVKNKPKKSKKSSVVTYDFDFSEIPSYVQYDVIPLPSNGQCYPKNSPLRCGRVPVAYLTAADENIFASPNVYRDGKLIDIILERKILDKRINIHNLCSGDRDAIVLWLRATSYGEDFPIRATNPDTQKQYSVVIKLSQFEYFDFNLESDDDGLFTFNAENGDVIKFKFLTFDDEEYLKDTITKQLTDFNKAETIKEVGRLSVLLNMIDVEEDEKAMLNEDLDEIKDIVGTELPDMEENVFPNAITEQMILYTVSVNGETDREYIKNYIENMRTRNAIEYRTYIGDNKPGVDFNFTVNIPESDGGGSFNSFLRLNDSVFINF